MKLEKYLNEEWANSFKTVNKETIEVFKNPTKEEMLKAKGKFGLRWLAHYPTKTIYAWDESGPIHFGMAKLLKLIRTLNDYEVQKDFIGGTAGLKGRKFVSDEAHVLEGSPMKFIDKDWGWVNRYIDVSSILRRWKKEVDRINAINKRREEKGLKQIKIEEEWKDTIKVKYDRYESENIDIFVDPTKKEMKETLDNLILRYLADYKTKKVYVFSPNILHNTVADKLGLSSGYRDYWKKTDLIGGIASLSGGIFKTIAIHNIEESLDYTDDIERTLDFFKKDWSFIDKYIQASDFLDKTKKKLLKIKAKEKIREQYEL